jgi:hypothetical protein
MPDDLTKEWKTEESGEEGGDAVGRGRKIDATGLRGGVTRAQKSGTTISGLVEQVPTMKKVKTNSL